MANIPVIIIGSSHPHVGRKGRAVAIQTFKHGVLPPMVEVRFDDGDGCFAKREEVAIDAHTCEQCGGQKAHSRLRGLFCPTCRSKR